MATIKVKDGQGNWSVVAITDGMDYELTTIDGVNYVKFANGLMVVTAIYGYASGTKDQRVKVEINLQTPFKQLLGVSTSLATEANANAYKGAEFNWLRGLTTNSKLVFEKTYSSPSSGSSGYFNGGSFIAIGTV